MDFLSVGATIVGGHFLSELLKGANGEKPAPQSQVSEAHVQGNGMLMSQEEQLAELLPREPRQMMGPLALDEHMTEEDEVEFWRAYQDTREGADLALMEYAHRLLSGFEGEIPPCPIAYGILAHRSLEIRRVHEILHAQRQQAEHAAKLEADARAREQTPPAGGASPAGRLEEEGEIEVKMEEEETPPPKPKSKPKKRVVVKTAEPSSANGATMPAPPVVGSEPHVNGHAKHVEA